MNTDLISKLKSINPTEGEWRLTSLNNIIINGYVVIIHGASNDDTNLMHLAPAMRNELLKMEEEIKNLRQQPHTTMTQKTHFTPEDVGRTFHTEKEGVTARLVEWDDSDETNLPCKFTFSNGVYSWAYKSGKTYGVNYEPNVLPSRPVEQEPYLYSTNESEVVNICIVNALRLDEKHRMMIVEKIVGSFKDEKNKLRIKGLVDDIDTEVEELAREIFIQSCIDEKGGYSFMDVSECFEAAETFIKYRNERRAGQIPKPTTYEVSNIVCGGTKNTNHAK